MPLNIYKASAGSGKTFTLTREYLRYLLKPGTDVRHILAITFTNAATADMKRKIIEALSNLVQGKYEAWKDLAAPGETLAALQERARVKLQEILHRYEDFSVKTIDAFVQNIIKPFAFELGLPRHYTPQVEEKQLSEDITLALLDHFGRKGYEKLSSYIEEYLNKQEQDQKSLRIQDKICHVVNLLFQEKSIEALEDLQHMKTEDFEPVIAALKEAVNLTEQQAADALEDARRIIKENDLTAEDFIGGTRGLYVWFTLEKPDLKKFSEPSDAIQKAVTKGILKKPAPCSEELVQVYHTLTGLDFSEYFLLKEVLNSVYSLALLNHAREILDDMEEKTGEIPISEFNQRIDKALKDEGNDFIFERCGTRYRHIFIDEFQDTSRLQWKNLRPLIENNLAQGNDCLLVGDAKQSLYRFRSADMEQFVNLCNKGEKLDVRVNLLESNWRSAPGIVAFNNTFYDFIREKYNLQDGLGGPVYSDHKQYSRKETGAYPTADPAAVRVLQIRNVDNEFAEEWNKKHILAIIGRELQMKKMDKDGKETDMQPGNIAVLCRMNAHCKIVSDFLVASGYKVSTPDSLTLAAHPGLQLTVASLEYMHFKHSFHKAKTFNLALNLGLWKADGKTNAYEVFMHRDTARRFDALSALYREQADLYDTVESVIHFWGLDRCTDQFLLCFLDQIESQGLNHIPDLADWWKERADKTCITSDAPTDSIRVMSIHKSKGLEFHTVIMPFVSEPGAHYDELYWTGAGVIPEETGLPNALVRYVSPMTKTPLAGKMEVEKRLTELDNLNALYVGTTRPEQRLYILSKVPSKNIARFNTNTAINLFVHEHPEYLEVDEDGSVLKETVLPVEGCKPQYTECALQQDEPQQDGTPDRTQQDTPQLEFKPWRKRMKAADLEDLQEETPEIQWGNFIHQTLSYIENYSGEKTDRALLTALQTRPQFKDRLGEARTEIEQILQHPELSAYFDGSYTVKTECPIASTAKHNGIPDRLLLKDNEAVILDYKTGAPDPKDHHTQLLGYKDLLLQMGYTNTKALLVYLNPFRIEEVK